MDSSIYYGFVIYSHLGEIPDNKQPELENRIKSSFSCEDWYYENSHIYNIDIDTSVKVEFKEETNEQEWEMGLGGYGLVFDCVFFAKDTWQNICSHKSFCTKVLNKITWKKQAFYLIDGKMVPLPITKKLKRIKRRRVNRDDRRKTKNLQPHN